MTRFATMDGKLQHCGRMARVLRVDHQEALTRLGVSSHHQLRLHFEQSYFCKAWEIDGQLAGLGGVIAATLAPVGFVWMALSDQATRHPIALIKTVQRHLEEVMLTKIALTTHVADGDDAALRLAAYLGFFVDDSGLGMPAVSHDGRRRLVRYIKTNPDLLEPVGRGHVVAMGYRPMEMT